MSPPRIEYAVLPAGDGPGQDRCFTAEGLVVVLDGASALDPEANPDATEYVDTLGPLLLDQIAARPGIDLRDALAEAIRQTAAKLALVPGTAPSSTVSVVRWGDETLDVMVLGDSPVVVQLTDGSRQTIVQYPQAHIAPELRRRYRQRLNRGSGYDAEHRDILSQIQRREASERNQPKGYFIAEAVPAAASHALISKYQTSSTKQIILATDGAERTASHLGLDLTNFGDESAARLMSFLTRLQDWESKVDPLGQAMPRSKKHDDKAIAIARSVDVRE